MGARIGGKMGKVAKEGLPIDSDWDAEPETGDFELLLPCPHCGEPTDAAAWIDFACELAEMLRVDPNGTGASEFARPGVHTTHRRWRASCQWRSD
jgi:hypothetical protein